jgi:hypothetical protein
VLEAGEREQADSIRQADEQVEVRVLALFTPSDTSKNTDVADTVLLGYGEDGRAMTAQPMPDRTSRDLSRDG